MKGNMLTDEQVTESAAKVMSRQVSESFKEILDGIKHRNPEISLISQVRKYGNDKYKHMELVDWYKHSLNEDDHGIYTSKHVIHG